MPEFNKIFSPAKYEEVGNIAKEYLKELSIIVSLSKISSPEEAEKIIDFLIGTTWAKNGVAYQWGETLLLSIAKGESLVEIPMLPKLTHDEISIYKEKLDRGA
jgi:hypothetical protein